MTNIYRFWHHHFARNLNGSALINNPLPVHLTLVIIKLLLILTNEILSGQCLQQSVNGVTQVIKK